jgi:hypothetical protein
MKTSKFLAVAALSILAAASAQAQGVSRAEVLAGAIAATRAESPDAALSRVAPALPFPADRSVIAAQAVAAARAESPDAVLSRVAPALPFPADRAVIHAQAVMAAHDPNSNLMPESFVNGTSRRNRRLSP